MVRDRGGWCIAAGTQGERAGPVCHAATPHTTELEDAHLDRCIDEAQEVSALYRTFIDVPVLIWPPGLTGKPTILPTNQHQPSRADGRPPAHAEPLSTDQARERGVVCGAAR